MKRWIIIFLLFISSIKAELPEILGIIKSDTISMGFGFNVIPAGDQNQDGFDDFFITDVNYKAYFYYGGNLLDTTVDITFDSTQWTFSNLNDITGDGIDDFIANQRLAVPPPYIYYGGLGFDNVPDCWLSVDTSNRFLAPAINSGDFDNNGIDDIIVKGDDGKSVYLFEVGNGCDSLPKLKLVPYWDNHYLSFGHSNAAGDFNGDTYQDIALWLYKDFRDSTSGSVYVYFGGEPYDTIPDIKLSLEKPFYINLEWFGEHLVNIGDVNNDSYDDLFVGGGLDNSDINNILESAIYFGGPAFDSIPDVILENDYRHVSKLGDVNNDGYNDILTSYERVSAGLVSIYYGGPEIDGVADYVIYQNETPIFTYNWGWECQGVGDVNGDGIDDFALSSLSSTGNAYGYVYIFAGWDRTATDVKYDYEPNLPNNFILNQNYPNPFNPTTTISFEIPTKSDVTLSIHNILGQKIRALINRNLSTGRYTLQWDGKNESGQPVSSGIYIYKLGTDDISISKKMMLLK